MLSNKKVGVAVAGLGFVGGGTHVPAFKKIPGAKLVAVIDVEEKKGRKVWGHYQIDSYFIECIIQGKKPTITVEDAIKTQKVAAKITTAARTHKS